MPTPHIPPDFTDEASYRAYLKAEAAGLVRINGKTPNSQQAQAHLAALNGNSHVPPDFTDEASYLAYLKAVSAGLVKVHGKNLASEALTDGRRAICASRRITPEDYLAALIAEGKTPLSAAPPGGAKPLTCPTRAAAMASLAAKQSGCRLENGKWVDCEGFVGVAVLRAA